MSGLLQRLILALLHIFAAPMYLARKVARTVRTIIRFEVVRAGVVNLSEVVVSRFVRRWAHAGIPDRRTLEQHRRKPVAHYGGLSGRTHRAWRCGQGAAVRA